jgi:hypothetical protein
MMYNSNTKWIIAISVTAIAIGAMVFVGNGLSTGIAQMSDGNSTSSDGNSDKSWSGTLNSLVDANNEKFIVGGEWTLSLNGNNVTEFSADIDMVSSDGTGAHTHRIISDGVTNTASIGNLGVVLVPTEQSVGKAVLVNVTGLAAGSNVTVKVDDNITGLTESDEDGNLLYAIGTAESMIGSVTVSVEDDEGNTGSALLTVTEAQESRSTNGTESTNNTSSSTVNNNLTRTNTSNTTTSANGTSSSDSGDNSTGTAGFQNNTSGSDTSADQAGYTMQTEIRSPIYGSENTTQSTQIMKNETTTASSAAGSNLTSSTEPSAMNATSTENVTSSTNDSTVIAEIASHTTTFTTEADIYLNGERKWEDVEITVSLMNGKVLTIEIDPESTDGHFGQEPIYGIVTLAGDLFR